ncbi:unnamed protein product [Caenorhabditis sp. 36 PRJEB53466]|nr:unnamed protein product [Caenorhabditis sp. 36 PRJEB53466]
MNGNVNNYESQSGTVPSNGRGAGGDGGQASCDNWPQPPCFYPYAVNGPAPFNANQPPYVYHYFGRIPTMRGQYVQNLEGCVSFPLPIYQMYPGFYHGDVFYAANGLRYVKCVPPTQQFGQMSLSIESERNAHPTNISEQGSIPVVNDTNTQGQEAEGSEDFGGNGETPSDRTGTAQDTSDSEPEDEPEAGPSEAGSSEAGPSEACPSEAGPSEAGPSEAGPSEAGTSEAGPSEAGPFVTENGVTENGSQGTDDEIKTIQAPKVDKATKKAEKKAKNQKKKHNRQIRKKAEQEKEESDNQMLENNHRKDEMDLERRLEIYVQQESEIRKDKHFKCPETWHDFKKDLYRLVQQMNVKETMTKKKRLRNVFQRRYDALRSSKLVSSELTKYYGIILKKELPLVILQDIQALQKFIHIADREFAYFTMVFGPEDSFLIEYQNILKERPAEDEKGVAQYLGSLAEVPQFTFWKLFSNKEELIKVVVDHIEGRRGGRETAKNDDEDPEFGNMAAKLSEKARALGAKSRKDHEGWKKTFYRKRMASLKEFASCKNESEENEYAWKIHAIYQLCLILPFEVFCEDAVVLEEWSQGKDEEYLQQLDAAYLECVFHV